MTHSYPRIRNEISREEIQKRTIKFTRYNGLRIYLREQLAQHKLPVATRIIRNLVRTYWKNPTIQKQYNRKAELALQKSVSLSIGSIQDNREPPY